MDAKPHRPARPFAAQTSQDENAPLNPSVGISKQLATQVDYPPRVNAGGIKAATKRSAFGDRSNTSHYVQHNAPAKSTVKHTAPTSKPNFKMAPSKESNKENAALAALAAKDDKNKASFLQPPQRPANGARSASNVQVPSHIVDHHAQPVAKLTGARKTSTVYHDMQHQKSQTLSRKYTSQPQLKSSEAPMLRRSQSKHVMQGVGLEVNADGGDDDIVEVVYESSEWANVSAPVGPRTTANMEPHQPMGPSAPQQLHAEHEEYWDEDDDEELYDDLGYTTVYPYEAYGDSTTGGTSSLLAPKQTAKVLKELEQARLYVEENLTQQEINEDAADITLVAEYGDEIFEYMRTLEERMMPNANYMTDIQVDIQWSMRAILMDWLVQVHNRFALLPETLFLTVNLIDRFLSHKIISLGKLQLVGATAIFVAAKYEEISCPSVREIIFMVDGGYTSDEILKAERFMLAMLDFDLGYPGPLNFLRRISKADDYDVETRTLAKYFLEVTVMDERFVACPGSYIAAGAHALARAILRKGEWVSRDPVFGHYLDAEKLKSFWSLAHVHLSGYTWAQLKPLLAMLLECCHTAKKHHSAVYDKYTDRRFKKASIFVQEELAKGFRLPFQNAIPRHPVYSPSDEHSAHMRYSRGTQGNNGFVIVTES
ncbi:unnamed protein product [Discula destructiva]